MVIYKKCDNSYGKNPEGIILFYMNFQKVTKNTLIIIIGRIVIILFYLLITVYLTRYLGSVELGKYTIVYAYLSFFAFVPISGINKILVREISKDHIKASFLTGNSLILCIILSIISILFSWIILIFFDYPKEIKNFIYIAGIGVFFLSISFVYVSIFQVYLEQKYQVIVEIISKFILMILTFLLIFLKAKLLYFFILDVIIALIILFGNRFFSRYFVKPKLNININIWSRFLKESSPLFLSTFLSSIVMRISLIILYQLKGDQYVGLYSAGLRIVEVFNIIPIALSTSIFPSLSKDYPNYSSSFNKTYELSLKYISFIAVSIAILITMFSKYIILLLYGEEFMLSKNVLAILIWSTLFSFTGAIFTQALIATENQKIMPILVSFDALFSILLNLIFIPKYGIIGASISTTISYILDRLICCIFFKEIRWYAIASLKCLVKPLVYFLPPGLIIYLIFF